MAAFVVMLSRPLSNRASKRTQLETALPALGVISDLEADILAESTTP